MTDRQERMQSLMRSFEEQAKKAGELQQAMKDLRGVGRSRDGAVTVTAATSGAVLGLQLSPNAMNRSHVQLQQEILDAIRMATQHAAGAGRGADPRGPAAAVQGRHGRLGRGADDAVGAPSARCSATTAAAAAAAAAVPAAGPATVPAARHAAARAAEPAAPRSRRRRGTAQHVPEVGGVR
ncbi:YbaB/EbfC family nucleoid-associated protein [Lentzea kentuckyensis]|uniref:YbaB/EbfC family nucleoid-associated protein n=1 Tax=Lentzea kentuckyensis TaxID=360086 RepID=UPI001FE60A4F|nr:YbaB/EbfC family nucleoid-associated protein [Lentzea kentuckyensis]